MRMIAMGAATTPPAAWAWTTPDRIWGSSSVPRSSAASSEPNLAAALDQLHISRPGSSVTNDQSISRSMPSSSAASSSAAPDRDGPCSALVEHHHSSHRDILDSLHPAQPCNPSHVELDLAPTPATSLASNSDHPHPFASLQRTSASESLQINALNLSQPFSHHSIHPAHQAHIHSHHRHQQQPHFSLNHPSPLTFQPRQTTHIAALQSGHAQQMHTSSVSQPVGVTQAHSLSPSLQPTQHLGPRKGRGNGRAAPRIKNELYKTEICRSYSQNGGFCKYGAKCQFAHGDKEKRPVRRHPRYKTKMCRNYVTTGQCPYGSRCRFIHASEDRIEEEDLSSSLAMLGQLDTYAPVSVAYPSTRVTGTSLNKVGLEFVSSDSQSTASPDQQPSFETKDSTNPASYLNRPFHSLDSFGLVSFRAFPRDLRNAVPAPSSSPVDHPVSLSPEDRSSLIHPTINIRKPCPIDGSPASSGDPTTSSPDARNAGQTRSRLPVFQTLSETFANTSIQE